MTGPTGGSPWEPGLKDVPMTASDPAVPAGATPDASAAPDASPPSDLPGTPPPDVPAAASAWVPPGPETGGGGRTRGCLIAAAIAAVAAVAIVAIAIVGLIFLGGQVQSLLKGTIEFGAGGTGCSVSAKATTFPASTTIHVAAHLEREVPAGETVTLVATNPQGATQTRDQTLTSSATCLSLDLPSGLPAGHYGLEMRSGSETLSKGTFDITP